jgi:serine/threonine protein kinase
VTVATEIPVLSAGATLAPGYTVLEHLHRSLRLDTYHAWSEERACGCVAKVLRPERRADPGERARLREEGERLVALAHPHIVRGYEVAAGPGPVVVMETLTGATLAHLLDERPDGLTAREVAWLGRHLASALRYLHGRGLVHLDVKPANVVAEAGRAKLIDLSVAQQPGPCPADCGTPGHQAPEQLDGGIAGPATDGWALGALLLEAATGLAPREVRVTRGRRLRRRLGEAAGEAVLACLRRDPARRPSLADLDAALVALTA